MAGNLIFVNNGPHNGTNELQLDQVNSIVLSTPNAMGFSEANNLAENTFCTEELASFDKKAELLAYQRVKCCCDRTSRRGTKPLSSCDIGVQIDGGDLGSLNDRLARIGVRVEAKSDF